MALTIWWCETHKVGDGGKFAHWQVIAACYLGVEEGPNSEWEYSCRMVRAELTVLVEPEELSAEWISQQSIMQHQREHGTPR